MSISNPKIWTVAMGADAQVNPLPTTDNTSEGYDPSSGQATISGLFPQICSIPLEAGGVAPARMDFNALYKELGDQIFFLQRGGFYQYDETITYEEGAIVLYNGLLYVSLDNANTDHQPGAEGSEAFWDEFVQHPDMSDYARKSQENTFAESQAFLKNVTISGTITAGPSGENNTTVVAAINGYVTSTTPPKTDRSTKTATTDFVGNVLADYPSVSNIVTLSGAQTISGVKTFSALPTSSANPTNDAQLARKAYVDSKVSAITVMKGASADAAGAQGLVPAPTQGYQGRYLRGDGTWATVSTSDNKVLQTLTSTNAEYPLLAKNAASTTNETAGARFAGNVTLNTSTGIITAPGFKGALTGNASTATKLATARTIRINLASTSTASFNGTANITPGVTGTLPIGNGGTGRTDGKAVNVTQVLNLTARGDIGYGTNNGYLPTVATIAYWNGAYNDSNASNLTYCANGTIVGTSGNQTISGNKTFSGTTTTKNLVVNGSLDLNGAEDVSSNLTVGGTSTFKGNASFSKIPTCSVTPTANIHLANKAYVDNQIAAKGFSIQNDNFTKWSSEDQYTATSDGWIMVSIMRSIGTPAIYINGNNIISNLDNETALSGSQGRFPYTILVKKGDKIEVRGSINFISDK